MKTKSPLKLATALVVFAAATAVSTFAGTFTSTQSGSWNSASTWGGAGVPGCGDTVTISGGTTVTESGTNCSGDLTVNGTLDMANNFFDFEGTTFTNNGAVISSVGFGEFDFNGIGGAGGTTQNLAGTGTYNSNGRVDFHSRDSTTVIPGSGTVLNGLTNWNFDGGTVLSLTSNFVVNGLTGSGQTSFINSATISGNKILKTNNNVAINSSGSVTALVEVVTGTTSASANMGPVTVDSGATLLETGTMSPHGDLAVLSGGAMDMANHFLDFQGTTFTNNGAVISSVGFGEFDFNGVGGANGTTQNLAGTGTYNTNGRVDFHSRDSTTVVPASGTVLNGLTNWNFDGGTVLSLTSNFVVNGLTGAGTATTFNNGGAISGTGVLKTHNNVAINGCGAMSAPVEVVAGTTSANCNLGAVTVDSGATLFETGTMKPQGDLNVLSGGTLDMNNQFLDFEGTTFTNNGAVITSSGGNGEFDFNGVGGASSTTQNLAGTGTYNTNGRVDFHSRDSVAVVPASGTVLNGLTNWNFDGGTVLSLTSNFVVNGLTGSGQTTFNNGGAISGTGILKTNNNVAIDGCGQMTAPLEVVTGTTSANCNLGAVTVDNGATLFETGTVHSGDLAISSGGTLDMNNQFYSFEGTTFTNNGAVISSSGGNGEFDFNGIGGATGTTQNIAGTGTYNTDGRVDLHARQVTSVVSANGAVVAGVFNNNIDGGSTFTNDGTMSPGFPPGQANVSGNWQLGSTSNLSFDIGGTGQGTTYDLFDKIDGGALTLNGNLVVHLINGFTPASSDTFTILVTQTTLQGAFSNVASGGQLATADGHGVFTVTYGGQNNVVLSQFTPTTPTSKIVTLSTRAEASGNAQPITTTFTISGTDPTKVLIRALGPSLGFRPPLGGANLTLQDQNGRTIASNDDWKSLQQSQIQATGLAPANDEESAVLVTLAPGTYTATLRGDDQPNSGIGKIDIHDLSPNANSKLNNMSGLGYLSNGDVVIGDFTITNPGAGSGSFKISGVGKVRVLIRALGPSFGGVPDPTLELANGNGSKIFFNDNWQDSQKAQIQATGLAPSNAKESAIVADLDPGQYLAIVGTKSTGGKKAKNPAGYVRVEVYQLQQPNN